MTLLRIVGSIVALLATICTLTTRLSAAERADADPAWLPIEVPVRGPDGRPLANAPVVLRNIAPRGPGEPRAVPEQNAMTDASGIARLRWPPGLARMAVEAPGVGYGNTGFFEVATNVPAKPPLPPLAPYAVLEGTVAEALRGPGFELRLRRGVTADEPIVVPIGDDGAFRAVVQAGSYSVYVVKGKTHVGRLDRAVRAIPGKTLAGLVVNPLTPEAKQEANPGGIVRQRPGADKQVTWVKGIVRDTEGKPVAGATVWAFAIYHGGIRMYEVVEQATTDDAGHYKIDGKGGLSMMTAAVVAHVAGRPPAWAWFAGPPTPWVPVGTPEPPPPAPVVVDLVIPAAGGTLVVQVLTDGKPAAGAKVAAWSETVSLRDEWAAGGDSAVRRAIEAVVNPVVQADANGMARFDALLPGTYELVATTGPEAIPFATERWRRIKSQPVGSAIGIPVRAGETTRHQLALSPAQVTRTFRLHDPDGRPTANVHPGFSYGRGTAGYSWSSGGETDELGQMKYAFDAPGLWEARYRLRATPVRWIPMRDAPFLEAEAVLANSPNLPQLPEATVTLRPRRPGNIRVQLKDIDGAPLQGVVEVGDERREPVMIGSTDADGVVVFEGLQPGKYPVDAYVEKSPPIDIGPMYSFPDEAQLRGRTGLLPQIVEVELDTDKQLTMQVQPIGFVTASVQPLHSTEAGWHIILDAPHQSAEVPHHFDAQTGRFCAGPLAAGEVKLSLGRVSMTEHRQLETRTVQIRGGQVTHVQFNPPPEPATKPATHQRGADGILIGLDGMSRSGVESLAGMVLLPDGKSPALGGTVMRFEPRRWQPTAGGLVDAKGVIRPRAVRVSMNAQSAYPPDDPPGSILIATLPGAHGAVVVPAPADGEPARLVLPPARMLRGTVTLADKPQGSRPGAVRVLAAFEGPGSGRLGAVLNVQTTASTDGTFELAGLTPGKYRVQAAFDDIWLSKSHEVHVPSADVNAGDIHDLSLSIAEPGGDVRIRVTDAAGKPAIGQRVTIDLPPGPLTEALWPAAFVTDGAGQALIPTLPTGRYAAALVGSKAVTPFEVKPVSEQATTEVRITSGHD